MMKYRWKHKVQTLVVQNVCIFQSYNLKEMYCTVPDIMVINYCCAATKQDEL